MVQIAQAFQNACVSALNSVTLLQAPELRLGAATRPCGASARCHDEHRDSQSVQSRWANFTTELIRERTTA